MAKWNVAINDFLGGFAPAWYNSGTYPSYGNKNQAGAMTNIDLTAPGFLTQGPGLANLTNGTQAAAITTVIKQILDFAVSADKTYGIGGTELYEISSTACTNTGSFPYTITAASGAASGQGLCHYQGNLYYSYNYTGAGDIGKYDLVSTFDDNWGSTVPTGATTLQPSVPHPMIVGTGDIMYIANGPYVATYDGTSLVDQALDLPTSWEIQSLAFHQDKIWIAANSPAVTGTNKNHASIFLWDGTTNQWEAEYKLMGEVGALHVRNNVLFVFYKDLSSTGGYKLGYLTGGQVQDIANFPGALPNYGQVTDYKDFILWVSSGSIYAFGAGSVDLPVRLFQIADGGYSTVGALATPFGTPMVSSNETTSYKLAQFSGYDVTCSWKSLLFDVTGETGLSRLSTVVWNFEQLATGASMVWSLVNNKGTTIYTDTISYSKLGAATSVVCELNGLLAENFRIEMNFASGSATNPVKVKNVQVYGTSNQ